jgi:hypothetical protein
VWVALWVVELIHWGGDLVPKRKVKRDMQGVRGDEVKLRLVEQVI